MNYSKICFSLAIAVAGVLPAGGASSQTLKETLVRAYEENPTLRSERARLRATDEGVAQALSNWRPTLQVSGSYGWKRSDSTISGPTICPVRGDNVSPDCINPRAN